MPGYPYRSIRGIALLLSLLVFLCPAASEAIELGSSAPAFSLSNLEGNQVGPASASAGGILVLYFFDASDQTIETIARLKEAASKCPDIVSLIAISRTNPEKLKSLIQDKLLFPVILCDDKGITLTYGFSKMLPAAVIVGPGGIIASILSPVTSAQEVLNISADALISMGLPASAMKVYHSMPDDWQGGPDGALATGYALILMNDADAARKVLGPLAKGASPLSAEAHAAIGFLQFRQGKNEEALVECGQAPKSGFADFVAGMAKARADECDTASALFDKATKGDFAFSWQKALAFNMAARMAEARGNEDAAFQLYRKAWETTPLDATINANLLTIYWQRRNFPAAETYAKIITLTASQNPIDRSLVEEFESDSRFAGDESARKQLENRIKQKSQGPTGVKKAGPGIPRSILICDLAISECAAESNNLSLAGAGLLRRSLAGMNTLAVINRPEMVEVAGRRGIAGAELQDPLRMRTVASDLSADLLAFGESGPCAGKYVFNLRIADVKTGEIIAVASERFASFDDMPSVIQRSVAALKPKL